MPELTPPITPETPAAPMTHEDLAEEIGTLPPEAAVLEQPHAGTADTAGHVAVEQAVSQTQRKSQRGERIRYLSDELRFFTSAELFPIRGTEEAQKAARRFFDAQDIAAVLQDDCSPSDLSSFIHELDMLQDTSNLSVDRTLNAIKPDALGDLFAMGDPNLTDLLEKTVDIVLSEHLDVANIAFAVEKTVGRRYGPMTDWKRNGKIASEGYPDFMKKIIEHPRFAGLCAESELDRILKEDAGEGIRNEIQNRYRVREAEKKILQEVLGVPKDMADDFRLSLRTRTTPKNEHGFHMANDLRLGGVDEVSWVAAIQRYGVAISKLGVDTAIQLYEQAEIVNFDHYPLRQLNLTKRVVVDRDPQAIKDLQERDVTVSFADAFSDLVNINESTPGGDTLVFELRRPTSLYRHFARLRDRGIKPCTAAINSHGITTGLTFGQGQQEFYFTTEQSDEGNMYSIERSSVRRLVHEYMQPSKKTGERAILLLACLQAAGGKASTAHTVAARTRRRDRVVVKASAEVSGVTTVDDRLLFVHPDSTPQQTVEFRRSRLPWKRVRQIRPPKGTPLI